jgi:hypothetical protein
MTDRTIWHSAASRICNAARSATCFLALIQPDPTECHDRMAAHPLRDDPNWLDGA